MLEGDGRFPAKDLSQLGVVAVSPADTLRFGQVVALAQAFSGNLADQIHEFIDGHQPIGTQIERFAVVGTHQTDQAFDAIVHVHKRACLLTVAPDLDFGPVAGQRYLTRDGRGCLLLPTIVSSQGTIHIVKTNDSGFQFVIFAEVLAQLLRPELLPPVAGFRVSRISVLLFQGSYFCVFLLGLCVDASG